MDERAFGATAREPLRKQLRRCGAAAERHSSASCGPRLGAHARVRDQRPQARRADRCGLCDPARDLFRFARRKGRQSAQRAYQPPAGLAQALERDFGSVMAWRAEFTAMAKALAGGSGWAILAWSERLGRLVNQWAADHAHGLPGATPIFALDMYEHAYHLDFGAKAAAYVDQLMANLNWERIGARYRLAIGEGAGEDELSCPSAHRRKKRRGFRPRN